MLQIGWVYENPEGKSPTGFRELVIALSKVDSETLFSTELVIIMTSQFMNRYRRVIVFSVFLPWLLYFLLVIFYMSFFAVSGSRHLEGAELVIEEIMKVLIVLLAMYFEFFEVINLIRDRSDYLDVYNIIDFLSPINNIYCMLYSNDKDRTTVKVLAALAVILMWFKAFYWMRMFEQTSTYIRLMGEIMKDLFWFMIVFFCIILLFSNAFMILNGQRPQTEQLYADVFEVSLFDSMLSQYLAVLGFGEAEFSTGGQDNVVWLLFILMTYVVQIVFLNTLIAIMGSTFDKVTERKKQAALREQIEIIADFAILVPRESRYKSKRSNYIFALSPQNTSIDSDEQWEGSVTTLKKAISTSNQQSRKQLQKRIDHLQNELVMSSKHMHHLDERVSELQNSQEKFFMQLKFMTSTI